MLRVIKPTSPMSVGTWILTAYGPRAGLAAAAEVLSRCRSLPGRCASRRVPRPWPADRARRGALIAPTSPRTPPSSSPTPPRRPGTTRYRELPFVFVASAAAASGGLGMVASPLTRSRPRPPACGPRAAARTDRRAPDGAQSMGIFAEPLHPGTRRPADVGQQGPHRRRAAAAALAGGRSRFAAALSGAALLAGSPAPGSRVFEAGQASAKRPPLHRRAAARAPGPPRGRAG